MRASGHVTGAVYSELARDVSTSGHMQASTGEAAELRPQALLAMGGLAQPRIHRRPPLLKTRGYLTLPHRDLPRRSAAASTPHSQYWFAMSSYSLDLPWPKPAIALECLGDYSRESVPVSEWDLRKHLDPSL